LPAYGLPATALGGEETHRILGESAGKLNVIVGATLWRSRSDDPVLIPDELDRAGVAFAFGSSSDTAGANLPRFAAAAVREGLSADAALAALTSAAAKMLRLDDKVGSLQRGRDGDLLIFDGEPFDARTQLLSVFIRGEEVR
jgi:imidazolonepropionase-like amidohydrolase